MTEKDLKATLGTQTSDKSEQSLKRFAQALFKCGQSKKSSKRARTVVCRELFKLLGNVEDLDVNFLNNLFSVPFDQTPYGCMLECFSSHLYTFIKYEFLNSFTDSCNNSAVHLVDEEYYKDIVLSALSLIASDCKTEEEICSLFSPVFLGE